MGRGVLTDEVKMVSEFWLGYEVSLRQLRLMPYLLTRVLANDNLAPSAITAEERQIISDWRKEGYITGGASGFMVSSRFYDTLCAILKVGYASDMVMEEDIPEFQYDDNSLDDEYEEESVSCPNCGEGFPTGLMDEWYEDPLPPHDTICSKCFETRRINN